MNLELALSLAVPLVFPAEGCKLTSYLDTVANPPVWTIGHGSTWVDGRPVGYGMTCSQTQADTWAKEDLRLDATEVMASVKVKLTDHQLAALTSLSYNIGIADFRRSDVLVALNAGLPFVAADRILEYDHAGLREVPGLTTRRANERAMFLVGLMPGVQPSAAPVEGRAAPSTDGASDPADALNQLEIDRIT